MIDFSKAPEGATHYRNLNSSFYRKDADGVWLYYDQGWNISYNIKDWLLDPKDLVPIPEPK